MSFFNHPYTKLSILVIVIDNFRIIVILLQFNSDLQSNIFIRENRYHSTIIGDREQILYCLVIVFNVSMVIIESSISFMSAAGIDSINETTTITLAQNHDTEL